MSETTNPNLKGVAETLLITLYIRALEAQRPDAIFKDDIAVALNGDDEVNGSEITKLLDLYPCD